MCIRVGTLPCLIALAAMAAMGAPTTAMAQAPPSDAFELEGDIDDFSGDALNDWVNLNCSSIGGSTAFTKKFTPDGLGYSIHVIGDKDIQDINVWQWRDQSAPPKDEIINGYAGQYSLGGDTILVAGGERFANNGAAYFGAWFLQNGVAPNADGTFSGLHKDGDVLILANFTQGGAIGEVFVFEWMGTNPGACPTGKLQKGGTLCDITPPSATGLAQGWINADAPLGPGPQVIPSSCRGEWRYQAADNKVPAGTIPVNSFFEVGINLTALGLGGECFATYMLETRSSPDVDASLKDFVLDTFAPCKLECSKSAAPTEVCAGNGITYTQGVNNSGGAALTVQLKDDNGTPADVSDDFYICFPPNSDGSCRTQTTACTFDIDAGTTATCTRAVCTGTTPCLPAGSTTNKVTGTVTAPPGVTGCEASATVIVNPNPDVSINHVACEPPDASFDLNATIVGGSAPFTCGWTVPGGTANGCSLERLTSGGTYKVKVTDAKNCTDETTRNIGYCSD